MQIYTLRIKVVSPRLVLLARHQGIVIIVSSVIIFVAGVLPSSVGKVTLIFFHCTRRNDTSKFF